MPDRGELAPRKARIVTLTVNPAIDISSEADAVRHTHKTRTYNEAIEPGGGGINVARVLHDLGANVCALFLGGGMTGRVLDDLMARAGIERRMIAIRDDSRISLTIVERPTGHEFRFVPEGPSVTPDEVESALAAAAIPCDYFVASGSLPPGAPEDFYAKLCAKVTERGARFVLDTSGAPLKAALEAGGIFLVKPSRGEFEKFAVRSLAADGLAAEAERLVAADKVENIAITLGREGAILVGREGTTISPAIPVEARSAVGAGDSFLAGMVYGFALGRPAEQAFRVGLAGGAAAVLSSGSDLARPDDLKRLVADALGEEVDDLRVGSSGPEQ
jgi:6-phosphofructokinase 2